MQGNYRNATLPCTHFQYMFNNSRNSIKKIYQHIGVEEILLILHPCIYSLSPARQKDGCLAAFSFSLPLLVLLHSAKPAVRAQAVHHSCTDCSVPALLVQPNAQPTTCGCSDSSHPTCGEYSQVKALCSYFFLFCFYVAKISIKIDK